jgi:hypothetical protein
MSVILLRKARDNKVDTAHLSMYRVLESALPLPLDPWNENLFYLPQMHVPDTYIGILRETYALDKLGMTEAPTAPQVAITDRTPISDSDHPVSYKKSNVVAALMVRRRIGAESRYGAVYEVFFNKRLCAMKINQEVKRGKMTDPVFAKKIYKHAIVDTRDEISICVALERARLEHPREMRHVIKCLSYEFLDGLVLPVAPGMTLADAPDPGKLERNQLCAIEVFELAEYTARDMVRKVVASTDNLEYQRRGLVAILVQWLCQIEWLRRMFPLKWRHADVHANNFIFARPQASELDKGPNQQDCFRYRLRLSDTTSEYAELLLPLDWSFGRIGKMIDFGLSYMHFSPNNDEPGELQQELVPSNNAAYSADLPFTEVARMIDYLLADYKGAFEKKYVVPGAQYARQLPNDSRSLQALADDVRSLYEEGAKPTGRFLHLLNDERCIAKFLASAEFFAVVRSSSAKPGPDDGIGEVRIARVEEELPV